MAGERLLVTGAAGFIGSAYVRVALEADPTRFIVVLDKFTYSGNPANLAEHEGDPRVAVVRGDIDDGALVEQLFRQHRFDCVVNFAAETHVDRSVLAADQFIATNVHGVFTLLEAARTHGVRRFLHVSTDEVYGAVLTGHSLETDPLVPRSPYAAAKAGGDLLVQSYHVTHGLDTVITRASNTIGPRQYPEKATPLFITNAIDDLPLPVYGDGRAVRDYLWVDDHCRAIDTALTHGVAGQTYNVGADCEVDTVRLANAIIGLLGKPQALIRFVTDRPGHDRRYSVDSSKLRALGWATTRDFDGTIEATVRWYRENQDWWRPIKSGEFREYYERWYGARLAAS